MSWRHGRTYWDWIPLRDGSRVRRSLGTNNKGTAREIERMIRILVGRRDWCLIEAAVYGPLTVGRLFDHWHQGDEAVRVLRARLNDVDLADYVEAWERWAERRASPPTVRKYRQQLRALIPDGKPFLRSEFTRKHIAEALASLPFSGSTARRYHAAWSSFAGYLVDIEVLDTNPLRSVRAPRNNPPRELWLPLPDVIRLVDAQPEPYRALAALREGAGVEISAALSVRRQDVDIDSATVFVRGTKTSARTRVVSVEPWAMTRIAEYLRGFRSMPAAPIFPGVSRFKARKVHRTALDALKQLDSRYTMHDARHSYAVRQMKAGVDPQLIASNLGHADAVMVLKVYGKYRPTPADLARAHMRAV